MNASVKVRVAALIVTSAVAMVVSGCPLEPFDIPEPTCETRICKDENPCTVDSCDPMTGQCRFDLMVCNDDNPCTLDSCDQNSDSCVFSPMKVGTLCEDDDACNGIETCDENQTCAAGNPVQVDDGDPCTTDSCDPKTGQVDHAPIDGCGKHWAALPQEGAPSPRSLHSAVWTGKQMIVWGGKEDGQPPKAIGTGARYDPATDTWSPISGDNAPSPRHSHSAVWTGTRMIVWGGFGLTAFENDGASYDPETDTWTPIASNGAPSGRTLHSATWSGTEMIIWGGLTGGSPLNSGRRYDPKSDSWKAVRGNGSPSKRFLHAAVWTGSELVIWGGTDTLDWLSNGKFYKPGTDAWTDTINNTDAPRRREDASALWTGERVIIWGGNDGGVYLDDGATLQVGAPNGGKWSAITNDSAPTARYKHKSVWTGSSMVIWGGCGGMSCDEYFDNGGIWLSESEEGRWVSIAGDNGLSARVEHSMVWTGSEVIIWGGTDGDDALDSGGRASVSKLSGR